MNDTIYLHIHEHWDGTPWTEIDYVRDSLWDAQAKIETLQAELFTTIVFCALFAICAIIIGLKK